MIIDIAMIIAVDRSILIVLIVVYDDYYCDYIRLFIIIYDYYITCDYYQIIDYDIMIAYI